MRMLSSVYFGPLRDCLLIKFLRRDISAVYTFPHTVGPYRILTLVTYMILMWKQGVPKNANKSNLSTRFGDCWVKTRGVQRDNFSLYVVLSGEI